MIRTSLCLLVLVCTSVVAPPIYAENWPQWRGPEGAGVYSVPGPDGKSLDKRREAEFHNEHNMAGPSPVTAPAFVASSTLGLANAVAASDRVTLGAIGLGARGRYDVEHFARKADVQCVAVCDCFADRRAKGKELVDGIQGGKECVTYRFHEEVLDRDDVDAVLIATGDRWHAVLSSLSARAGKDVYSEKPFSLTIGEGRALSNQSRT